MNNDLSAIEKQRLTKLGLTGKASGLHHSVIDVIYKLHTSMLYAKLLSD